MSNEKWSPEPYAEQELLSFERLKRAVMNRTLDRAETEDFPISAERTAELTREEWQRAKEAVRSSPAAREAFRKHLEGMVSDEVDTLIKTDKSELGAYGVAEKSL
jgi:hypothetical protein